VTRSVAASDLRRPLAAGIGVAGLAVAGLVVAEALDIGVLVDPGGAMGTSGPAALVGTALLVADVILPVPSSLVMVAHGALFGVVLGTVLNLAGRTAGALAGVMVGGWCLSPPAGVGRPAGGHLAAQRCCSEAGRRPRRVAPHAKGTSLAGRALAARPESRLVERWGLAAVVVTRPVPVLAEATVVAAGAAGMRTASVVAAAALGSVPEALLYAVVGAASPTLAAGGLVLVGVLVLATAVGAAGRSARPRRHTDGVTTPNT